MPQSATIHSLPAAFWMMKAMQAEGLEWGEDYRGAARRALAELLQGRMGALIDQHLERMAALGHADRRNGCYRRRLLTELGEISWRVPRTRTFSALEAVRAYARRARDVDRLILTCFVLGFATRKVAMALLPILGRLVSPATVSRVAKQLDAAVAAFHRRPLKDRYRVLVLDGVVLKRKTGAGVLARPVLVALGLRPDGKKEVIDFRLAGAESAAQWEDFLGSLVRCGLIGERLEMLCVDGGAGLLTALATAFPDVPVQRLDSVAVQRAHKVRKPDRAAVKADLAPDHERHDAAAGAFRSRSYNVAEANFEWATAIERSQLRPLGRGDHHRGRLNLRRGSRGGAAADGGAHGPAHGSPPALGRGGVVRDDPAWPAVPGQRLCPLGPGPAGARPQERAGQLAADGRTGPKARR